MIIQKIKNSLKLEQILLNFIDVLRINIFVVDSKGHPVLVPKSSGHGFHGATQWGGLQYLGTPKFLSRFQTEDRYLKFIDMFGFQVFAIPIPLGDLENLEDLGYLIVGPVVLNKQLEQSTYKSIAQDAGVNFSDFLECLVEIRVLSFNSLKSILDLLFELSRYSLRMESSERTKPAAHSVFTNLLDLSMALSQAECGSIMLLNKFTNELSIYASKGIDPRKLANVSIKLGEGIAGLAAQQRENFVINGEPNNRISHLLKKPELKCALVLPIVKNNKDVLGVLNISTCQGTSRLATHTQQMLQSLVEITSGSFTNFL